MNRDKCRSDAAFIVYGSQAGCYRSSGGLARLWIERGYAPAVLYGDVPAALNGYASRACFMGSACAPLERTPLLRIERGYAPTVLNGYVPVDRAKGI